MTDKINELANSQDKTELTGSRSSASPRHDKLPQRKKKRRLFSTLRYQVSLPPALSLILPSLASHHASANVDLESDSERSNAKVDNNADKVSLSQTERSVDLSSSEVATSETQASVDKEGVALPSRRLELHHYPMHVSTHASLLTRTGTTSTSLSNSQVTPLVMTPPDNTHAQHSNSTYQPVFVKPDIQNQHISIKEDDHLLHGQLSATDKNVGETIRFTSAVMVDGFTLNPDGSYTFDPSNNAYQSLKEGEVNHLTVPVTVTDSSGLQSHANFVIKITGTNDVAQVTGQITGQLKEDVNVNAAGLLTVNGQVFVQDADHGESHTIAEVVNGQFGALTIDEHGHWRYQVDNSLGAVQQLNSKQQLTEVITIHTADHTSQQIQIVIGGSDDNAVISGIDSGNVVEDLNVINGSLKTTGDLHVVDADKGEAHFLPQLLVGQYGNLTIDSNGHWYFEASNQQSIIQQMGKGDELREAFTVSSVDGTTHQIHVEIDGVNDLPHMIGQSQTLKEDGAVFNGQMVATDIDQDLLTFTTSHPIDGLTFNTDGSYTFDPNHTSYQHLAKGDTQVVTTTVTVTDSAGGSHREELKFTIEGTNDLPTMSGQSQTLKEDGAVFNGQMVATDVDQDLLTFTTSHPIDGLTFNIDGSYTFDPSHTSYQHLAKGDTQVVTTTVTVTDSAGGSHREELKFTIEGTNDLPTMTGQSQTVKEDGAVFNGQMVATDIDQDLLTFTTSHPIDGLTFNTDGSYTFDPSHTSYQHLAKGDTQVVTTTVTVTDSAGGTHREELKFTIEGTNDLPTMSGQSQTLKEDGAVFNGQMVATDVDQDLLTFKTSHPIDGLTFNTDGSYTFDPSHTSYQHLAKGDTQVVTTTVTVTDSAGGIHDEELKFTIEGTNDLPTMSGQSQTLKEDGAVFNGQMVATDVDHDLLTFTTSHPIDGLTFNTDGSYTFDPSHTSYQHLAKGDTQVVTTTVTVTDTAGGTHQEQLKFTITGTNDLPVMAGQLQSVKEDGALFHGQMVATDVDQDLLTYSISHPIDGLTFNSDGSYTFNPSHSSYQHLSQGSTQQVSTTVTVTDSSGGSHQETLEMVVSGTNDRPIVSAWTQLQNGMEDKPVIIKASDLLTHGSDIDSADTLIVTHLQATNGVVVDNHDGTYTFTPNKDYNGEVRLTYRVEDNHGAFVETQARFNLAASPDNAVITDVQTNVDLRGVTEDRGYIDTHYMLHYDGQLNIQDPDVGEAQFDPNIGSQTYQGIGYDTKLGGHVLLMRDGRYTYTLDNRNIQNLAEGEVRHDFATIRSVDGTTHTMEFTVHGTNDAPTVAAQSHSVTEGGSILSGQMQGHDVDTGATLTYSTPNVDGLVFHSDGSYSFNPDHPTYQSLAAGVTKTLSIPVTVTDEHHASSTSVLTITVTGANNAAVVAGVDTGSVDEGAAGVNMSPDYAHSGMALLGRSTVGASGQLSITDVDSGEAKFDTHGFGYTYAGKFGDLHLTEQGKWFYYADMGSVRSVGGLSTNRGTQIDQLVEGQTLTDTVTVYTKDGTPHDIVITIHGDNDRPYCSSEVTLKAGAEDTRQTITVGDLLANTVDVDANDAGQLTIENLHADHGSIQHNADGTFTFSPEKDYNGQVHFTYDVKDAHGGVTSTGASMTLAAVNDNPDTQPLTDSVTEDSTNHHVLDLLSGASDKEGDALSVQQLSFSVDGGSQSTSLPDGISLSPDGHTLVVDATHHAFQHLAAGHTQQVVMSYMVDDGHGGQTAQTATLSIQGSDDKATMVSHTIQLTESQALRSQYSTHHGNLQLTDPDTGDSTQFVFSGQYMGQGYAPGHLTVWPDGSYQFYLDPARNHHADDRIASLRTGESMEIPYQVETSDGQRLTLIVKVTGEDDQARIQVGPYSKFDNDAYEDKLAPGSTPNQVWSGGTLQVIDPDHDQAGFVAQRIDTPEGGHFSINVRGGWQYTIDNDKLQHLGAGQSYQKTFTVESIDGSAQRDITVTVHGRNDDPVVTSAVTIPAAKEDQTITLTVKQLLANTTDVDDNDANQLTIDNLVADHGSITDNHDGTYTFTPDPDYNGQVQFTYDVKDAHGGSTTSGASLDLVAVNDASKLASGQDSANLTEDQVRSGTHQLETGWINLGVTDVDGATEADIAFIEVNGVKHAVPANFAMNLTANHGYFSTTHSTDGHNKWSYTADNDSPDIQGLKAGQQLQDSMVLITKDGTRIPVTATINGQDDHVIIDTPDKLTAAIGTAIEDTTTTVAGTLQAHDLDKGDQISFELATASQSQAGSYGTFYLDSTGHWRYDLDPAKADSLGSGEGKVEVFDIVAISSDGSRATQQVEVLVQGTNDAPVVSGSISLPSGEEDHSVTLHSRDLLANATDVDNYDRLSVTSLQADHGVVKDNHDGTYTFTPEPNYNGAVHFTYDVRDTHGGVTSASATLQLSALSDAAQITAKGDTLKEDHVLQGTTTLHSTGHFQIIDPDGASESFFATNSAGRQEFYTGSLGGTLQVNKDGGYFYDVDNSLVDYLKDGEVVKDQFTIVSADGTTKQVEFTIQGTSDNPYIGRGSLHQCVFEDEKILKGRVYGFDPDHGDQQHLTFTLIGTVPGFTLNSDGSYVFDPSDKAYQHASLSTGMDEHLIIPIKVTDRDGLNSVQNLRITIIPTNDAPVVTSSVSLSSGTEDQSVTLHSRDLLANASDIDDYDRLSVTSLQADHGVVKDNHDGTYTFTPEPNYNGAVHFSYNVTDNHGASTPTSASLTLAAVDDKTQFVSVNHGAATEDVATHMSTNVDLKDAVDWQALQVTDVDSTNTQITVEFAGKQYTWTLGQDLDVTTPYGKFQFHTITSGSHQGEHAWSYIGDNTNSDVQGLKAGESLHESIKLTAKDGTEFPIQVEVRGTEDGVIIDTKGELAHVTEDSQAGASVSGQLVAHDTDIHDQVHWTESPSSGVAGSYGTFHVDAAGHWHYVVDQSRATQLGVGDEKWEYFNVEAVSSDGSRVTKRVAVVVHGQNDNPTVSADVTLTAGTEDTPIRLTSADLLANATHVDNNDRGWLRVANLSADHGTVTTNQDGSFTFTPNQDYNGVVQFSYDVIDRHGGSTSAHASVSLQAVNDLPAIHGDIAASVIEKGVDAQGGLVGVATAQGTLTTVDPDTGDSITWQVMSPSGTYGRLTIDQHGHWHYQLDDTNSAVQALPNGRTVQDSFVVTATDKSGVAVQQTVIIDVQGSNDGATIDGQSTSALSYDITEDSVSATLSGHLQLVDIDSGEDQFVPLNQVAGTYGHLTLNAQGDWTYVLDNQLAATNALHSGQVVTDHFTVTSPDGMATKSITVNVHGHDDLATLTVSEGDSQQGLDLLAGIQAQAIQHIQYSNDGIHFSSTLPTGFSLAADGHTLQVDASGGSYDHLSTGVKQSIFISYEMVEGTGLSAQVTQQHGLVEVIGTSDAPVLHSFSPRADQFSGPITGNLLSGATDVDDGAHLVLSDIQYRDGTGYHTLYPGQSHSITGVGTISIEANGDYSFTPDPTFTGSVPAMWYRVVDTTDSQNIQTQRTLHISIDANHQPTVTALSASFNEDTDLTISASDFGYTDHDSDALHSITITHTPDASHGHLILDGHVITDGSAILAADVARLIFRPVANYNGSATFSYTANDGHSDSSEQHAQLTITSVNDAPAIHLAPVTPLTGVVTQTDVDVGDTHQFSVGLSAGNFGTLTVDPDSGVYQYVPNGQITGMRYNQGTGHYTGQDTFEVTVTDKAGESASLFVTFNVDGTVTAPVVSGQAPSVATHINSQPTVTHSMPNMLLAAHHVTNHVTVDLASTSDSGRSHSDNLTNDETPTISGHTDIPFSKVNIYDGSKVVGSGYSDAHGHYQVDSSLLSNGVHNISVIALAPGSVVPVVSSRLAITIDTHAPAPTISVDTVTRDNVISASESQSVIAITGLSSGDAHQGDIVTLSVGRHSYTGQIDATGHYSIDVPGAELEKVSKLNVSISTTDAAGNTATTSLEHHYDVDTSVGSPTISFENPGADNLYSKAEIAHGAAGTITATVHAASDAKVGEHLNVNGVDHVLDAQSIQHGVNVEVAPNSIVKAVMTDEHGNVNSAINVAAGAKPEPIVVTAPSGSHHISASLGAPVLMPTSQPVPTAQQGWKILVNGHYHTTYTSQWGTLSIDPKTGDLSYQEHANVHTGPHGSAQNVGVHADHFEIALQGSHQDDVLLHVQVSILSHGPGHSGKLTLGSEVLDMTVTPVISHNPPPPPPAPHVLADEPMQDSENTVFDSMTIMSELGIHKGMVEDDSHHQPDSVHHYMDKLGISNEHHQNTSPGVQTALPDDIDVVLNDDEQNKVDTGHADSHHDVHSGVEHLHDADTDHLHDDPTLPDDLNS